jgi:DNA-directed RNA polymerase subunit RPC12/RpoP
MSTVVTTVTCPNCGSGRPDFIKTGDIEVDGHRMLYYGCNRCQAKVSVLIPAPPPRTDMMG